jgi:hypothetical protein
VPLERHGVDGTVVLVQHEARRPLTMAERAPIGGKGRVLARNAFTRCGLRRVLDSRAIFFSRALSTSRRSFGRTSRASLSQHEALCNHRAAHSLSLANKRPSPWNSALP